MNSIVYVGMDVHKENYTLCCYNVEEDLIKFHQTIAADYRLVLRYLEKIRKYYPDATEILCGYEAGCLGYSLYHQLSTHGVSCVILAPSTMGITNSNRVKTDRKDAANIARCLAFHTYSAVYIPTRSDEEIKEYIRMREDHKNALKNIKRQILALLLRQGCTYTEGNHHWTIKHTKWMRTLDLKGVFQKTLEEYLSTYDFLIAKIERLDQEIEELAHKEEYAAKVKKLVCFIGIQTYTALSIIVETGDFRRFKKAGHYAAYLGLIPSEHSSGGTQSRSGITKAGNAHLRRLLIESAQSYTRGATCKKSKELIKRQVGNPPNVIGYADKANERLKRKFYRLTLQKNKKRNVAVTGVARELACFIWGMMNDAIA